MINETTPKEAFRSPQSALRRCLKQVRQMPNLYGNDVVKRAADYPGMVEYCARASFAGIKLPPQIPPWTPVLFEWIRDYGTHKEVVIVTSVGVLHIGESKIEGGIVTTSGEHLAITLATARKVSRAELFAYTRRCSRFVEFVAENVDSILFRIKKLNACH